jgi:UDP-glucose 4-epimerase
LHYFVTGPAGFIGSHLVDRLLADGHEVTGYDNFSTGQEAFLKDALRSPRFHLVSGDTLDRDALGRAMKGADGVFHLAANADVRFGTLHPRRDLEQNTIATFNVLEAMRLTGARRLAFASTGSVYGEASVIPTPEDAPFPVQTSLYGASKLAAEGLIAAYSEGFGLEARIFRFVSILGERYTHGHVFDFYRQLRAHPNHLDVLGDGRQRKSYLYVGDCIDGMLAGMAQPGRLEIYNLGADEYCEINDSIGWICARLGLSPERRYAGGDRGWVGDNPFIFLDCARLRARGWQPRLSIREGIIRTLDYLVSNPWLLERRPLKAMDQDQMKAALSLPGIL